MRTAKSAVVRFFGILLVSLALSVTACSRCSTPAAGIDAAPDVSDEPKPAASRCKEEGPLLRIAGEDEPVEIGNGVVAGAQAVIGLTVGGHAKVILFLEGKTRSADLGALDPAAPPPLVIADGPDVLAAHATKDAIVIDRITEAAGPRPFATVSVGAGDDLAFDVAIQHGAGLVAWTYGDKIRTARVPATDAGANDAIAKPAGDVSSPRIFAGKTGFALAYLVTRMDSDAAVKGAAPWWDNDVIPEGPADRVWPAWVELANLDADGKVLGATTSVTGHEGRVTAFDFAPGVDGFDVLVRDATATGEGAALIHIRGVGSGAGSNGGKLLADGLGPGAPILFPENWAAFIDPGEGVHLLPLDSTELREPSLDLSQPLVAMPMSERGGGPKLRVIAVKVGEHGRGAELRITSCTR